MMTVGQKVAAQIVADEPEVSRAALAGNAEALDALLSLAAQKAYVSGLGDAAATAGVLL